MVSSLREKWVPGIIMEQVNRVWSDSRDFTRLVLTITSYTCPRRTVVVVTSLAEDLETTNRSFFFYLLSFKKSSRENRISIICRLQLIRNRNISNEVEFPSIVQDILMPGAIELNSSRCLISILKHWKYLCHRLVVVSQLIALVGQLVSDQNTTLNVFFQL